MPNENTQIADSIWQNLPDDTLGGDSIYPTVALPDIDLNKLNTPPQIGQHNLISSLLKAIVGDGPPRSIQEAIPILLSAIGARGVPLNLPRGAATQFNVNPRTRMNEFYDPGTRTNYTPAMNSPFHEPPVPEDLASFSRGPSSFNVGGRTHHFDDHALTQGELSEWAPRGGNTATEFGDFRATTFDPIIEQLMRPLDRAAGARVLTPANRTPDQEYNQAILNRLLRARIKPVKND